jgi:hypothetical protein
LSPSLPPPQVRLEQGHPRLTIQGEAGRQYRVEFSDSLTQGTWQPLSTVTLSGPTGEWQDPGASNAPMRFYRVVPVP